MPVARIALGWALNCPSTSLFRLPSDTERVTIIPVAVEIIRAGSWDTQTVADGGDGILVQNRSQISAALHDADN